MKIPHVEEVLASYLFTEGSGLAIQAMSNHLTAGRQGLCGGLGQYSPAHHGGVADLPGPS